MKTTKMVTTRGTAWLWVWLWALFRTPQPNQPSQDQAKQPLLWSKSAATP